MPQRSSEDFWSRLWRQDRPAYVLGLEMTRVDPLADLHAGIEAQAGVDLAVAHVEGHDVGRPTLEQAVREAARRGTDVETAGTARIDAQLVERPRELLPAARNERPSATAKPHAT